MKMSSSTMCVSMTIPFHSRRGIKLSILAQGAIIDDCDGGKKRLQWNDTTEEALLNALLETSAHGVIQVDSGEDGLHPQELPLFPYAASSGDREKAWEVVWRKFKENLRYTTWSNVENKQRSKALVRFFF